MSGASSPRGAELSGPASPGEVLVAMLCYAPLGCLPLPAAAACFFLFPRDPARRFHAAQGLLLHAATVAAGLLIWAAGHVVRRAAAHPGRILFPAWGFLFAAWVALGLFLAVKAYGGEPYRLPWLGRWALALARRRS